MKQRKTVAERIRETQGNGEQTRGPGEVSPLPWEPPIPFSTNVVLPPFPIDCLPSWLGTWVKAEAEATQTPPDLAAMLSLAIAGAGLAKKIRVAIRTGWTEPLNIFSVAALQPGERKSAVFSDASKPVQLFEKEELERLTPIIAEAESSRRVLEAQLKAKESQAAKVKSHQEAVQLKKETKVLARELAQYHVPASPQMFVDDVTPEALSKELANQGGRILQASAEGTAFEIAKGRYSESANFEVYLKGHAGDPLRVNRVGREKEIVDQPALSLALAVQPDVIRGLGENVTMKARGFLARFFYSLPTSKVGERIIAPQPVPEKVAQAFTQNMVNLWRTEGTTDEQFRPTPHLLQFSQEADLAMRDFESWLEPQLAEGAKLSHLAGWANKLAGGLARIAGIFHMAETIDLGQGWQFPIDHETIGEVIRLGREYLLPHAQVAFGMMSSSPFLEDAKRVLMFLKREFSENSERLKGGALVVTKSKIHSGVFGGSRSVDDVDKVIGLLEKHQFLRPLWVEKHEGRGRSPGPRFEVNPALEMGDSLSDFQNIQGIEK